MVLKKVTIVGNAAAIANSFYLSYQANSIEKQLEYGTDGVIALVGAFHPATAIFSLYWSLGGKQLHKSYNEKVIQKQMEIGMNPGLPALQPFK